MLLDVILFSFIVAFLRGGRIKNIPTFHKLPFLAASLLLQLCSALMPEWGGGFVSLAYVCMLLFFFYNRAHEDIRIFLIGWLLNSLVIWTNLGRMPVDLELASKLPYSIEPIVNGTDFKHTVLSEATHLPFLGDIIYMPLPIPRLISVGDLFIMLGTFFLVQRIMNKPISLVRLRAGKHYAARH
ncbi:DUF5317 domain-containing protein [Brevibacillus massiliensis]|uniref:DUF5317 domain-containing protein n=1 Tax=Brevibacillus massiliensis TaxID=1118054 RepID=UPI0002DB1ACD|nr:DUF5317 domain-containing protein [Brevibacillus massiliensis]